MNEKEVLSIACINESEGLDTDLVSISLDVLKLR